MAYRIVAVIIVAAKETEGGGPLRRIARVVRRVVRGERVGRILPRGVTTLGGNIRASIGLNDRDTLLPKVSLFFVG